MYIFFLKSSNATQKELKEIAKKWNNYKYCKAEYEDNILCISFESDFEMNIYEKELRKDIEKYNLKEINNEEHY